jgi:hypothetical protein
MQPRRHKARAKQENTQAISKYTSKRVKASQPESPFLGTICPNCTAPEWNRKAKVAFAV